jgi:hypothetical protein
MKPEKSNRRERRRHRAQHGMRIVGRSALLQRANVPTGKRKKKRRATR